MNKTKIEWLNGGYTWNPVTGCLNTCEYCYARKIANRFRCMSTDYNDGIIHGWIDAPHQKQTFPYGFEPTFYECRLNEPQKIKKPQNIFVCSMADLFGDWMPDLLIRDVFQACEKAPQHRYFFLTKNPLRYGELIMKCLLPQKDNFWYGMTITKSSADYYTKGDYNYYVSAEPILERFWSGTFPTNYKWIIIGAETGNRKNKVIPKKEWVDAMIAYCKEDDVPIFMKNNLKEIWGDELIQQYPFGKELK